MLFVRAVNGRFPSIFEMLFELLPLTQFDRKTGGELHLNKLPEFIKVLEGCNDLQNIQ